jgi:protein-disulfide isomerase
MNHLRMFFLALALAWCGLSTSAGAITPDEAAALPDRVLGKADAPVSIIEYASLTCSHCAHFHEETFPKLKEKYIDTGKVKLILRDYPNSPPALRAAAIARCLPESSYYAYMSTLFKSQNDWAQSDDPIKSLLQYAKLGGLSSEDAEACANSTKLMDAITANMLKADQYYMVAATPTFVFNEGKDKIAGAVPFEQFAAKIEALLAAAAKAEPTKGTEAVTTPAKPEQKPTNSVKP